MLEEPRSLRERIVDVLIGGEWTPFHRILKRLEGHPDTWILSNRSNVRRRVWQLVAEGVLEAWFNDARHRYEYRLKEAGHARETQ